MNPKYKNELEMRKNASLMRKFMKEMPALCTNFHNIFHINVFKKKDSFRLNMRLALLSWIWENLKLVLHIYKILYHFHFVIEWSLTSMKKLLNNANIFLSYQSLDKPINDVFADKHGCRLREFNLGHAEASHSGDPTQEQFGTLLRGVI